jgi:hypothetical protein
MIILIQEEIIKHAENVLSKGQDADITVIGIMGVFCLVMGFIAVALWKANKEHVKDLKNTQKEYLTTLITLKTVMSQVDKNSEKHILKTESNGGDIKSIDLKVESLTQKLL